MQAVARRYRVDPSGLTWTFRSAILKIVSFGGFRLLAVQKNKIVVEDPQPVAAPRQRKAKPAKLKSPPEAEAVVAAGPVAETDRSRQASTLLSTVGTPIDPLSLLFDIPWYCIQYPDVAAAALDPIRHFFDNGAREGRDPNPYFATTWYVSSNADVAASKMNPFLHYLLYGAREGRQPKP